jgi:hypothetical protein
MDGGDDEEGIDCAQRFVGGDSSSEVAGRRIGGCAVYHSKSFSRATDRMSRMQTSKYPRNKYVRVSAAQERKP